MTTPQDVQAVADRLSPAPNDRPNGDRPDGGQVDATAALLQQPDIRALAQLRATYPDVSWTLPGDPMVNGWVEGGISPTTPKRATQAQHLIDHFRDVYGWRTSERPAGRDYVTRMATGWWGAVPVAVRATLPAPDPLTGPLGDHATSPAADSGGPVGLGPAGPEPADPESAADPDAEPEEDDPDGPGDDLGDPDSGDADGDGAGHTAADA